MISRREPLLEPEARVVKCATSGVKHPEKFHLSLSGCDLVVDLPFLDLVSSSVKRRW